MNPAGARIAILIVARARGAALDHCFDRIARQNYPPSLISVFIHINAGDSADIAPRLETLRRAGFASVHCMEAQPPQNVTARRRALSALLTDDHDLVLYLDDTVYLESHTITVLAGYLASHPGTGVIGPRTVYAADHDTPIFSSLYVNRWTGAYFGLSAENPTKCDAVTPLCMMVRRTALVAAGGFCETYLTPHDGIDLCLSIREQGYAVVYHPGTTVEHDAVFSYPSKGRLYYLYRNKLSVAHRHFTAAQMAVIAALTIAFRLPIYLLRSIRFRKMIDRAEWSLIIGAVFDGAQGLAGKKEFSA